MEPAEIHNHWAERSGDYSPDFYANLGPDDGSEWIHSILDDSVDLDAAILELGCSAGRNLAHLREQGYKNLYGIEINKEALGIMENTYPPLAADGTFYLDAIEEIVPTFEDNQFDVVFSVETLQHIHPDNEWVFDELTRITSDYLITIENENSADRLVAVDNIDDFPLFYREWNTIFTRLGFKQIASKSTEIDTYRVFRNLEP
ncbi:class I SAM-dependent methyltransferase [Natrinema sp. 1APR25-10V2]|nr:class I SAM-dependent methyltransferase [Natrinema sp. 1APR25-10V2]